MRRLILLAIITLFFLQFSNSPALAKGYSYKAPKSSSFKSYSAPRTSSNPRYIMPKKNIPVPKTQTVKPYIKKNGTAVQTYQRAPKGSLKPYYNPLYQKKK